MRRYLIVGFLILPTLSGCNEDRLAQLDAQLDAMRHRPVGHLEALPEQPAYRPLHYHADQRRSPFESDQVNSLVSTTTSVGDGIRPDPERPREPLEAYAVSALRLVGTLTVDGHTRALIQTPQGEVVRLRTRQYIGDNNGRVMRIDRDRVDIIELMPDGSGGFMEAARTLSLGASE